MTPIARTWGCHGTLHAFVYDKKTNDEFLDAVAEHNALVDAYEQMQAENARLRAALEFAKRTIRYNVVLNSQKFLRKITAIEKGDTDGK